jgi:hypothetical protein
MNHARDILRGEQDEEISLEKFKHPTIVERRYDSEGDTIPELDGIESVRDSDDDEDVRP